MTSNYEKYFGTPGKAAESLCRLTDCCATGKCSECFISREPGEECLMLYAEEVAVWLESEVSNG